VVAIFRSLGVPKRLAVLVEAESLLNDGTAIVLFNLVLAAALGTQPSLVVGLIDFVRVSVGGVLAGAVLGWLVAQLIARVDDYLIEITLTTILAFGAYLTAERLQVSGVLAVAAAGLVTGSLGLKGMSPTTRIVLHNLWEYVAFLANSFVFLLIGLQINVPSLAMAWQPILWAIVAVLIARGVLVYGLSRVTAGLGEPISLHWRHVLAWGGLRGAISLALALSLPTVLGADRNLLLVMAYGVVLFTLLVQGTTIGPLLRHLRLGTRSQARLEFERRHARLMAARAAEKHLEQQHAEGLLSTHAWDLLRPALAEESAARLVAVRDVLAAQPELGAAELSAARREAWRAQRNALLSLRRDGVISTEIFDELAAEVDLGLGSHEDNAVAPPA
jgi:CPA1 family monovalent cation:H+ antiporter